MTKADHPAFGGIVVAFGSLWIASSPALAASHLWRINEIFSNATGTIQFIELKECCGSTAEHGLGGKTLTDDVLGSVYTIQNDITGNTAGQTLLFGTAAFAALPGAPPPDFIIPAHFFSTNGDTINWAPVFAYDDFTFAPGALPTNGTNSLQITNFTTHTFTTGPNTPKNYAGDSATVDASCTDTDGDGYGNPGLPSCPNGSATDCNNDNAAIHPGATELCTDGLDNDCNALTDCDVPACAAIAPCVPAMSDIGMAAAALLILEAGVFVVAEARSFPRMICSTTGWGQEWVGGATPSFLFSPFRGNHTRLRPLVIQNSAIA